MVTRNKIGICTLFTLIVFNVSVVNAETSSPCSLYDAKYKPHPSYNRDKGKLDFVMTVKKPEAGEGGGSIRSVFFYIDAFDAKTSEKVSSLRMGNSCSNGVVVCAINAEMGQFSPINELKEVSSSIGFSVIALKKDFSEARYDGPEAPYAYVLPHTASAIHGTINGKSKEHIPNYVRYYSEERVFPDFSGYDVWVLSSCVAEKQ